MAFSLFNKGHSIQRNTKTTAADRLLLLHVFFIFCYLAGRDQVISHVGSKLETGEKAVAFSPVSGR
ncbi:hypothetical protein LK13_00345 [Paenibacillus polymyxa]|nr:hypothetical protein LK13_00345 [Paenibacillus polymyxa]KJK31009.1 hypothetical protein TY89_12750 [Paenibacillus polymyxa]